MTDPLDSLILKVTVHIEQLNHLETQLRTLEDRSKQCNPLTFTDKWRCAVNRASLLSPDGGVFNAVKNAKYLLQQLYTASRECGTDHLRSALVRCCSVQFLDELQTHFNYIVTRYIVYHTNYARTEESNTEVNNSMLHLTNWCKHFNYSGMFKELSRVFETCSTTYTARTDYRTLITYLQEKALQAPCTSFLPTCGCSHRYFWETCNCPVEAYAPPSTLLLL